MASGFHPQTALDTGAIPAQLQLSEHDAVLTDMACWLMGSEFTSTAGGMLPEHQLQPDTISPAQEALDVSWLTAQSYEAAGSNMQPTNASLQHAASAVGQGRLQPAEGLASNRPYAAMHKGAYQPLSERWTSQLMADVDVPSSQTLARPLEQGQSSSLAFFNDLVKMHKASVHQQPAGTQPCVRSPAPSSMLPSMHPGSTPLRQSPPTVSSGAMPDGLGAGYWLDSSPMQHHLHVSPRLPALLTAGSFPHVSYRSEAAHAGESPDSAQSARMPWHLSSRQAMGGQGEDQAAAADFAASGIRPLQSQVSDASSASHAGHQFVASGVVTPGHQPGVFASWSAGQRPDTAPNAALLSSSVGHKRKAAESEVFEGHLDDLDSIDLEGMLGDVGTAASWEASAGNNGDAAHAGEQRVQLEDMGQVQASAQQLLPAPAAAAPAAAAAAAETQRPRKKRKTGHASSSPRAVPQAPVPNAAHDPAHGSVMHAARPVAQDRPVTGPSRSRARTRYQPYARPNPQPQRQPLRKTQPRSQAQPQVAAAPSNPAATHAATAAATTATVPAATPTQESGNHVGQVVWGKSGKWPWWPATVQEPDAAQRRATKMGTDANTNKVFLVYFKTREYEALPKQQVRQWAAHKAPTRPPVDGSLELLLDAVQLAKQAITGRTQ